MSSKQALLRCALAAAIAVVCTTVKGAEADPEVRAMWVLRTSLTSPQSIASLVTSAKAHGFNTLFVQVRGRGDAYFRGGIEPLPADVLRQAPDFDPLASVVTAAQASGLRVHAWINVNLVSSAAELPTAREHLVHRHPEWLMVPRDIAQQLAAEDIHSPAYLGKLARWTRQQSAEVEGLYASPIVPAAAAYTERIVRDIARRYPLDGIHFDYARYPTERYDYSRAAIAEFRNSVRPQLAAAQRRAIDADETVDLFAYPDALPDEWRRFRVERMTSLIARLGTAVKQERPAAVVSLAAFPDQREALSRKMQDWGAWLNDGLIDAVCPMVYTQEPARFAEQVAAARQAAGSRPVWAGIGAYRLSAAQTVDNIQTARRLGAAGVVLFSYDSMINPRQTEPGYLSTVGRGAFDRRTTDPGSR